MATSDNMSQTASEFGDRNQTRLSNLNQNKNVRKRKCHFYGDIEVDREDPENITFMELWKLQVFLEYFLIGLWKGANTLIRLG